MTQIYIGYKCNEIDTCIPQPFVLQDKIKININCDISYDFNCKNHNNRKNRICHLIHTLKNVRT